VEPDVTNLGITKLLKTKGCIKNRLKNRSYAADEGLSPKRLALKTKPFWHFTTFCF